MANTYSFHCICDVLYKDGHRVNETRIYNTPYELGDINLLTKKILTKKYHKKAWEELSYSPDVADFTIINEKFSFDLQ